MAKRWVRGLAIVLLTVLMFAAVAYRDFLIPAKASTSPSSVTIERYSPYYLRQSNETSVNGAIKVTYYGTTMLLFDDGETQLLVDAHITRPSAEILLTSLATGEPLIKTDEALVDAWLARPEVGNPVALFIAHTHPDHAMDAPYIVQKTGAHLYGTESTLNLGRGGDVAEDQMSRYKFGEDIKIGKFTVSVQPGKHTLNPAPLADDRDLTIDTPLRQPYRMADLVEGGSHSFLIRHGRHSILIQPTGHIVGMFDDVRADVLFLSTVPLGFEQRFVDTFYVQTVSKVQPKLVVPIHWDDFAQPLSENLAAMGNAPAAFDYLIERLSSDQIQFGVMQGYRSVMLFGDDGYGT